LSNIAIAHLTDILKITALLRYHISSHI